jgi:hypothetical protein
MQYEDVIPVFAEVAIAITGFSGVVSIFGGSADERSKIDSTRLISLLTASLSAFIFCLIALALLASSVAEETTWRIVSAMVALERITWTLRFSRVRSLFIAGRQVTTFFYIFFVGNIVFAILSVTNVVVLGEGWPFLWSIVWYLIESSWVFVRLVLIPIRDT